MNNSKQEYLPISSYAAIGNLYTTALVGTNGSIDWCCFPDLDDPSVYAAILDHQKGGYFKISVQGANSSAQKYIPDSNVLETIFSNGNSEVKVIDFFPLSGDLSEAEKLNIEPEIIRIIECIGDECDVTVEWAPRLNYARDKTNIKPDNGLWIAENSSSKIILAGIKEGEVIDDILVSKIKLKKGEKRVLINRWGNGNVDFDFDNAFQSCSDTVKAWQDWARTDNSDYHKEWAGEYLPYIIRSELVLKLLDYPTTGAIAAAPTTSLPETIGGVRNWDYRYAWIRDASLAGQALYSFGHEKEAVKFLTWLEEMAAEKFESHLSLQIMFTIKGGLDIDEKELDHFEGYKKSAPVRIGNDAAKQFQLETFGEVFLIAYEMLRLGIKFEKDIFKFFADVADFVSSAWKKPDYGIWELRSEAKHFIYSKVMAWVVLDLAVYFSKNYGLKGNNKKWEEEKETIKDYVLQKGYNEEVKAFVQSTDSTELDAANLRFALIEFLPADDYRIQNTIDKTIEHLSENGFVYRYKSDDGLPGKEGAFNLCTFWLVDVLALSGRLDEAKKIYSKMLEHANHVGLFSEQIDPATSEFLGNFPQAFTHIGLINSAIYIRHAEGKDIPIKNLMGTKEHRKKFGRDSP
jgi:GH15 family glucan-1,4-alpha-glucosidase